MKSLTITILCSIMFLGACKKETSQPTPTPPSVNSGNVKNYKFFTEDQNIYPQVKLTSSSTGELIHTGQFNIDPVTHLPFYDDSTYLVEVSQGSSNVTYQGNISFNSIGVISHTDLIGNIDSNMVNGQLDGYIFMIP